MRDIRRLLIAALCAGTWACSGTTRVVSASTGSTTTGGTSVSSTSTSSATSSSAGATSSASSSSSAGASSSASTSTSTSGSSSSNSSSTASSSTSTGSVGTSASSASSSSGTTTGASGTTGIGVTTAGPWPNQSVTTYSSAQGIAEEIVDVSVDEAQNLWAVSHSALYVMRPGQGSFRRYTDADGLHLGNAAAPGIMTVAGGRANEGFVGYNGADITDTQTDPKRFMGKLDHVALQPDGSLVVDHIDVHNDDHVVGSATQGGITDSDFSYNEDRGARRMLYDHRYHPGTLYVGWNHGVDRIDWGRTDPTTGLPFADHVHPSVYDSHGVQMMAEWRGLALDPVGHNGHGPGLLWMGGQFTGGAIDWTPALYDWTNYATNPFVYAFGPWAPGMDPVANPPVFPATTPAESVNIRAVTVTPGGTVWFASGPQWDPATDHMWGLAKFEGAGFSYVDPVAIGLPSRELMDLVALPDGSLAIGTTSGLYRYDPGTGALSGMAGPLSGVINHLYLDTMVSPPALYVAAGQGFAVLRD